MKTASSGTFDCPGPSFDDLLSRVGERITYQDTNYRRSISPAERLSICLRLIQDHREQFQGRCLHGLHNRPDVAAAIWDCLVGEFMAVPTVEEWRSIAEEFEERWNFPLCCGAVDGKHVKLKAPPNSGSLFFNYRLDHSLVLLAVVDARYRFRVIDVGGYGRTSDGGIFASSAFGQALREGTLHLPPDQNLPGADHRGPQPHVFVADEAFPLQQNLMRPYSGRGGLAPGEHASSTTASPGQGSWWKMPSGSGPHSGGCSVATVVEPAPGPGAAAHGLEPLPDVGRMGANNASQEATRVREVFKAHFCGEGAVAWQPAQKSLSGLTNNGSFKSHPLNYKEHNILPSS
ncbi:hypothetical protein WMY93_011257 [Mugilogobius chulae]|uniref:DDE Tnp4 domain-containing protein n=1 Tax=Mugilogobius chulae TaxID=88201 RepID=A0AAW0PD75_9GOBI